MHAFEEYLLSIGYRKHKEEYPKKGEAPHLVETSEESYSSLGALTYVYRKEGSADIRFGLNEAGKPATLVHPRPEPTLEEAMENQRVRKEGYMFDDDMNRLILKLTPEQLYNRLEL
jgi:hypothetical protein